MTGYATGQQTLSGAETGPTLGLEIRSVNSRFLDLGFRLSDELRAAEPVLRELITGQLRRGKVEVRAWIEGRNDGGLRPPSPLELQKLLGLQDQVHTWLPDARGLSVSETLSWLSKNTAAPTNTSDQLTTLARSVLKAFAAARAREGKRLAEMLQERTTQLRTLAQQAQPLVPQLVELQRQRFLERWQQALGAAQSDTGAQAAQDRALTEATAYAIRIDVAEELTRLASHLDEIDSLLGKGGELGKRLDFLIQELHREANTLGSKASSLELTRISVDMKVLIEQMREQVQNIE
jgi:uncharacterized protein (TIGR00255 family)